MTRLLETEQRLEDELRAAKVRAEALRAEALAAARRREAGIGAALAAAEEALAAELLAERRRRETEIAAATDRVIAGYASIDESHVIAVARQLIAGLIAP